MHKTPKNRHSSTLPNAYPGKSFTCVTCETEIRGRPTFWVGLPFCCAGCAVSGPCTCSYDFDFDFDLDLERGPGQQTLTEHEVEHVEREPVLAAR